MLFVALRYTSYIQHQRQEERRNNPPRRDPPVDDMQNASTQTPVYEAAGRQEASLGGELLAGEGVSLG
jgi:hypothetical protein